MKKKFLLFTVGLLFFPLIGGCKRVQYGVDIVNYGRNGVLILQYGDEVADSVHPSYYKKGVKIPIILGRWPSIPSNYRDPATAYGRFPGHEHSLPDEFEIAWQLADLRECKENFYLKPEDKRNCEEVKSLGYNPANHTVKNGCTWVPLPDKIFRKKLDLRSIRESEAYKKAGQRSPWIAGSRYRLNITLIFDEDRITVKTESYASNPWK